MIWHWYLSKKHDDPSNHQQAIINVINVSHMGVSGNRGTPSHHPFYKWIFPQKNHPAIGVPLF